MPKAEWPTYAKYSEPRDTKEGCSNFSTVEEEQRKGVPSRIRSPESFGEKSLTCLLVLHVSAVFRHVMYITNASVRMTVPRVIAGT